MLVMCNDPYGRTSAEQPINWNILNIECLSLFFFWMWYQISNVEHNLATKCPKCQISWAFCFWSSPNNITFPVLSAQLCIEKSTRRQHIKPIYLVFESHPTLVPFTTPHHVKNESPRVKRRDQWTPTFYYRRQQRGEPAKPSFPAWRRGRSREQLPRGEGFLYGGAPRWWPPGRAMRTGEPWRHFATTRGVGGGPSCAPAAGAHQQRRRGEKGGSLAARGGQTGAPARPGPIRY